MSTVTRLHPAGDETLVMHHETIIARCPDTLAAKRIALAIDLLDGIETDDIARMVANDVARAGVRTLAESVSLVAKIRGRHG